MSNPADAKRIEEMQKRLDHVEDEIDEARHDAEKVVRTRPEESFAQTGTADREDADKGLASP
jgi:hypothetical protein